jgi:hypothetical protein
VFNEYYSKQQWSESTTPNPKICEMVAITFYTFQQIYFMEASSILSLNYDCVFITSWKSRTDMLQPNSNDAVSIF